LIDSSRAPQAAARVVESKMLGHAKRSDLVNASTFSIPGVGTYDVATRRPITSVQPNLVAFSCSGQRSELSPSPYPALPHAYSPVVTAPLPHRSSSPSFGVTSQRTSLVPPGAWSQPGPGAYDLAGRYRPRGSPLTVGGGRARSPRRRVVSVATLAPLHRSPPSIPYAAPPATSPSPAEYTLPRPHTVGGGANVMFGRNRAPRMPTGGSYGGGGAAASSPGPGAHNPGFATGVGGVYKLGVPLSSLARSVSPGGAFQDRSAALIARDAGETPGPGAYLGPWGGSGFLHAARRDVPEALQFLGSRAARGDIAAWGGGGPGPGAYGGDGARLPSPPRGSPLGGSEPRFRLPPDEAAVRENPGPGAYGPPGWAGLKLPSARRGGAAWRTPSPPPPRELLSRGTAAALLARALAAAGDAPPPTPASPLTAPSPPPPSRPPTRASPLQPLERPLSPGPIYDTSLPLGRPGFNAVAARGELMGLGAERGAGGALAAAEAAAGPGPGAYSVPRVPMPLPVRPPDMGPLPQAGFGKGRRAELSTAVDSGEYTNPHRAWEFEKSFNAKAFAPVPA
jgi:hypothetical protein